MTDDFTQVDAAIKALAEGKIVIVLDDEDRENEGDFIMAADLCTPSSMAQIVRYSSGVVCIALEDERLKELELPIKKDTPKFENFKINE